MHETYFIVEKKLPISTRGQSQPLVSTAQYTTFTETCDMIDTNGAEMVTASIRRTHIGINN